MITRSYTSAEHIIAFDATFIDSQVVTRHVFRWGKPQGAARI